MLESIDYLRCNHTIVGWRFTTRNYQGKRVKFDVPKPLCSSFLRMMHVREPNRKTKYTVFLVNSGGRLVSEDERGVYEVTSAEQGQWLLNMYYFCFDLKGKYIHADSCNFAPKSGMCVSELYNSYRMSFTQGLVQSREHLKYSELGKIPRFHNIILNAASGVRCNTLFSEHIHAGVCDSSCDIIFSEFPQMLSFMYNFLSILGKDTWEVTLSFSPEYKKTQYEFKLGNKYKDFFRNVVGGLGIDLSTPLMYEQMCISGKDDICSVASWGHVPSCYTGQFYRLYFTISEDIPSAPISKKYSNDWV